MNLLLNQKTVKVLRIHKLGINDLIILHCLHHKESWHEELKLGITSCLKKLKNRKYIDSNLKLTELGISVLRPEDKEVKVLKVKVETNDVKFEEFWKTYPSSDKYGNWSKTRVLRSDKVTARRHFNRIIQTEDITADQLIQCLQEDIKLMKKGSIRENRFTYMPRICSWLNKRIYEGYLEDIKEISKQVTNTQKYGEELK